MKMPINDFDGNTFLGFLDISGLKELMKNEKRAWRALDRLYQCGYESLHKNKAGVEGLFISDCGILFVRGCQDEVKCLKSLLVVVKDINREMLKDDLMLTTSIAYGNFKYQKRIEFVGIEKNPIYGNAYVSAFFDNEKGSPSIQPGQCRIVKKNLPENVTRILDNPPTHDEILSLIRKRREDRDHYYFYWMCSHPSKIDAFEMKYREICSSKFKKILEVLKNACSPGWETLKSY